MTDKNADNGMIISRDGTLPHGNKAPDNGTGDGNITAREHLTTTGVTDSGPATGLSDTGVAIIMNNKPRTG